MADRCTKPTVYFKRGSRIHEAQKCNGEEEKLCSNCEELNTKFGLILDIRHSAFDRNSTEITRKMVKSKMQELLLDIL